MHIASVTSRCSRAGAEALRQGAQLAADARDTCRAGALLLRGSPCAIGWVAGWLSAEFPARVVTGHGAVPHITTLDRPVWHQLGGAAGGSNPARGARGRFRPGFP